MDHEEELVDYEADEEEEEDDHDPLQQLQPPPPPTDVVNDQTKTEEEEEEGSTTKQTPTNDSTNGGTNQPNPSPPLEKPPVRGYVINDDDDHNHNHNGRKRSNTTTTTTTTTTTRTNRNNEIDNSHRSKKARINEGTDRIEPTTTRNTTTTTTTNNNNKHPSLPAATTTAHSGVYIPPFRRRQLEEQQLQQQTSSSSSSHNNNNNNTNNQHKTTTVLQQTKHQREQWEKLKKTINGTINRLNTSTIKPLIQSLFRNANLIRGKGLLSKALLRAVSTSPSYCPIYASLIAVINTKLPEIGELVLTRTVLAFRKAYARLDKGLAVSTATFLGCLFNQGLCHELLCLQILTVLLEGDPTDDSVEVAVKFTQVVGMGLLESSPAGVHAVMERFRGLLHDGTIGRRVQYKVEELMKVRRKRFEMFPMVEEELDLVERDDQIMFEIGLDDEGLKREEGLDVFQFDERWDENEAGWVEIRTEILGDDDDDESGSGEGDDDGEESTDGSTEEGSGSDDDSDDEDGELDDEYQSSNRQPATRNKHETQLVTVIQDMTEKDLIHLRRTIYLTIMSSATFEECTHKLTRLDIPDGKEVELINMIIECCSQERTFLRYYGLVSGRFCLLHRRWREAFEKSFTEQYQTIHRLGTNKLRNVAKLFAHLLHTDSMPWSCLASVHLNEDETTSSSRIFLKILVQEMAGAMGIAALVKRFETEDEGTKEWYKELFPRDKPRNTRYAINFFTSIGLGPLTDGLREHLKNAPKLIKLQAEKEAAERAKKKEEEDGSSTESSSSCTSDSSSVSSSSTDVSSSTYSSYDSRSYSSSGTSSLSHRRKSGGGRKKRGSNKRSRSRSRSSSRSRSRSRSASSYSRSTNDRKGVRRGGSSRSRSQRVPHRNSVPTEIHGGRREEREPQRSKKDKGGTNSRSRRREKEERSERKHRSRSGSYSSRSSSR